MDIKVGDTLYNYSLKKYEVVKIGRKWIYVKSHGRELRVSIETLKTESDYLGNYYQLYVTKKEVEKMRKIDHMKAHVSTFFRDSYKTGSGLNKITDLDLEEVYDIISKYK